MEILRSRSLKAAHVMLQQHIFSWLEAVTCVNVVHELLALGRVAPSDSVQPALEHSRGGKVEQPLQPLVSLGMLLVN